MAVDVSQETSNIRKAIYGKDVRASIADGIDEIAEDVNTFEKDLTKQQNDFESNITNKDNNFENDITNKENGFEASITKKQNDYESNVNGQWNNYKQNMDADESTRQNNETIRESNEVTRQGNEASRQTVYNDFRNFVNSAQQINRVPYLVDGGNLGDTSSTGLTLDGGDL